MSVQMYRSEARIAQMSQEQMSDYIAGLQALAELKPDSVGRIARALETLGEVAQTLGFDAIATEASQVMTAVRAAK